MTGCLKCGTSTPRRLCRDCARDERYTGTVERGIEYECPDCGGPTSGEGVTCFECRGEVRADGGVATATVPISGHEDLAVFLNDGPVTQTDAGDYHTEFEGELDGQTVRVTIGWQGLPTVSLEFRDKDSHADEPLKLRGTESDYGGSEFYTRDDAPVDAVVDLVPLSEVDR